MPERRSPRFLFAAFVAAVSVLIGGSSIAVPILPDGVAPVDATDWQLVFEDEFDTGALDPAMWTTCYWWVTDGCKIGSNGELEWYQPGNVTLGEGVLQLTARREPVVNDAGERFDYTSGMVTTGRDTSDTEVDPRFAFTYGRVEIRARLPAGRGLWPAFWLLPLDHESRPEIDVMEVLGDDPSTLRVHYHYVADGEKESAGERVAAPDLSAGWHTYSVEWSPTGIVWYLDGVAKWWIDDPAIVSDEPMYVILNLAVGGDYPGEPDASTQFPSTYLVDYVRVWQSPGR